jgi:hypothetical protein
MLAEAPVLLLKASVSSNADAGVDAFKPTIDEVEAAEVGVRGPSSNASAGTTSARPCSNTVAAGEGGPAGGDGGKDSTPV